VFYPFHPRAGEHIFVVGARSHRDENCYVIALENGKSELIPEWMTKSDAQNMSIISTPTIKIEALQKLRILKNNVNISPSNIKQPKIRRENEFKKVSSTPNHLGRLNIPNTNSSGNPKETDRASC